MNRLEKQLQEMENTLKEYRDFSAKKLAIFNKVLPEVEKVLKSYGIKIESTDNMFVDKFITAPTLLVLRIYVKTNNVELSKIRKKNLEQKLRGCVPMPICPIRHNGDFEICYHD